MSIAVDVARLAEAMRDFTDGYLLTTSADGRVKAVSVSPAPVPGDLYLPFSHGSARNLAQHPSATLLFPPRQPRGHTLLVDGTAVADDDKITFTPQSAVLHRPADHAEPASEAGRTEFAVAGRGAECSNDCVPL